ncbi:MAG TPA: amidohydrolase family protein [Pseudomonadales bacterium]|nr:amidohydrolase family protein [Pseudomonadales bacterium]
MPTIRPIDATWLAQVQEPAIDPQRRIVDPHHHLWRRTDIGNYALDELWADTGSGHNVVKTVFVECGASYRTDGPEHLQCIGETEFVAEIAGASAKGETGNAVISAIVAHADLTQGAVLAEVLAAHADAGRGLFRGIRHAGARDPYPDDLMIAGRAPEGLYARKDFRDGMKTLGRLGYTYDTWHYHHQNPAFADLARAVPDTTMVLDHFGTPLGVGRYASQREAIFAQWKKDIAEIAKCRNVVAKLGGLAMPDNGFGWSERATPPTSDEFVAAQKRYYLHTIECFGPNRCMFESNFPVDKWSLSYAVYWNGVKKIVADFSESEKDAMFYGTAARVYRLG